MCVSLEENNQAFHLLIKKKNLRNLKFCVIIDNLKHDWIKHTILAIKKNYFE